MYGLVRINGLFSIAFGLLLVGLGIAIGIVGITQNSQLVDIANSTFMVGTGFILLDTRFYTLPVALVMFFAGLGISANGQLLISIANGSSDTHEILEILKDAVKKDKPAVINNINVNTDETKQQGSPVVVTTSGEKS